MTAPKLPEMFNFTNSELRFMIAGGERAAACKAELDRRALQRELARRTSDNQSAGNWRKLKPVELVEDLGSEPKPDAAALKAARRVAERHEAITALAAGSGTDPDALDEPLLTADALMLCGFTTEEVQALPPDSRNGRPLWRLSRVLAFDAGASAPPPRPPRPGAKSCPAASNTPKVDRAALVALPTIDIASSGDLIAEQRRARAAEADRIADEIVARLAQR